MTGATYADVASIDAIKALAVASGLPSKVRKSCHELAEKFDAPLRIGIFGLNGSGKRRILNALLGEHVALESGSFPTVEVLPGRYPTTTAMLADGATIEMSGCPDDDILSLEPMFLSVTSAACHRLGQSFLLIVCDDTVEELSAGLSWAAPRIDLAIWCTTQWTEVERSVFERAPDHLKDHAIFCLASSLATEVEVPQGFDSAFILDTTKDATLACAALADHVGQVIDAARAADILAAEVMLHRYQDFIEDLPPWTTEPPNRPSPPDLSDEAKSQLSYLFRFLRSSAERLREAGGNRADLLASLEEIFEQLAEQAMECHAIGEAWPELDEAISDARDLCVLLNLEGGDSQVEDAARMLLQLRWDMEAKLAA